MRTTRAQWWLRIGIVCYTSQITKFIQYRQTKSYAYTQHLIYAFSANSILFYCRSYTSTPIHLLIYLKEYIDMYIYMNTYTHMYRNTYTYTYTWAHTHTHAHTYIFAFFQFSWFRMLQSIRADAFTIYCGQIFVVKTRRYCNVTLLYYTATGFYYR